MTFSLEKIPSLFAEILQPVRSQNKTCLQFVVTVIMRGLFFRVSSLDIKDENTTEFIISGNDLNNILI